MKEPVDHIERPRLPWRSPDEPTITECGYDASKVKTLTREDFAARLKEYGQQRAALFTCMTCMQTSRRWQTWETDPRRALQREIEWEITGWGREKNGHRLKDELIAIQQLIEKRPEEFLVLLKTLRDRHEWLDRKEAAKPKKGRHRYDGI